MSATSMAGPATDGSPGTWPDGTPPRSSFGLSKDERRRSATSTRRLAWAEFTAILDRRAKRIPELAKLLDERAPWDE